MQRIKRDLKILIYKPKTIKETSFYFPFSYLPAHRIIHIKLTFLNTTYDDHNL